MITDDERRKIAQRLIEADEYDEVGCAVNRDKCYGYPNCDACNAEAMRRLASMIEPPVRSSRAMRMKADELYWNVPESDGTVRELRRLADEVDEACAPIDRDALLALADELDRVDETFCEGCPNDPGSNCRICLFGKCHFVARAIREALGERNRS